MKKTLPRATGLVCHCSRSLNRWSHYCSEAACIKRIEARYIATSRPTNLRASNFAKFANFPRFQGYRYASTTSSDAAPLERTALYDLHLKNGAKMVPFAGYSMPVQYSDLSVGESHKWTRENASLFDVGHMYGPSFLSVQFVKLIVRIGSSIPCLVPRLPSFSRR